MAADDTIHVRGEGGAVFEMALPLPEHIAERLAKGYLRRVNADGTPYVEDPAPGQTGGSDLTEGRPPRPEPSARKADWVAYAVHVLGLRPDDAEARTKQDLIDLAGSQDEQA